MILVFVVCTKDWYDGHREEIKIWFEKITLKKIIELNFILNKIT